MNAAHRVMAAKITRRSWKIAMLLYLLVENVLLAILGPHGYQGHFWICCCFLYEHGYVMIIISGY
jgi:hypothetical protein